MSKTQSAKQVWGGECSISGASWLWARSLAGPSSLALSPQNSDSVPPGYEPISLLEALNGLRAVSPAIPSAPLYEEVTYSGISDGLSQASCPLAGLDRIIESGLQKGKPQSKSPDR